MVIMEDRLNELERQVVSLHEQVKKMQFDLSYMQKQIDNNTDWIEQEEKSKILL